MLWVSPQMTDECTSNKLRVSYARDLIEVDVTVELRKSVVIKDHLGRPIVQPVQYEWQTPFCKKCQRVGHDCGTKKAAQPKPKQAPPKQKVWQTRPERNQPSTSTGITGGGRNMDVGNVQSREVIMGGNSSGSRDLAQNTLGPACRDQGGTSSNPTLLVDKGKCLLLDPVVANHVFESFIFGSHNSFAALGGGNDPGTVSDKVP